MMTIDLDPIYRFLGNRTPDAWIQRARVSIPIVLIDHANCEKKAASTALNIIYRYSDKPKLCQKMSRLAREELRHFEQVLAIMEKRNIQHDYLSPGRYAGGMHTHVHKNEPKRLVDTLIVGAFIEARSCERFAALVPYLDDELAQFYQSLLKSESRHFEQYLDFARQFSKQPIDERVDFFRDIEAKLIESADQQFRFHSGVPIIQSNAEQVHDVTSDTAA